MPRTQTARLGGRTLAVVSSVLLCLFGSGTSPAAEFIRGDANRDGTVSISDATTLANFFFINGNDSAIRLCQDAADANDDGNLDVSDDITVFHELFPGFYVHRPDRFRIAPPFPDPGEDPTEDEFSCDEEAGPAPDLDASFIIEVGEVEGLPGQVVSVPVYGTSPVIVDAFSLALSYDPTQIEILGFTFEESIYEELGLASDIGIDGSGRDIGLFGENVDSACRDLPNFEDETPRPCEPELPGGEYRLGVLNSLLKENRLPPLNREVLLSLKVQISLDASGEVPITPVNGIGSPPIFNEYSVLGDAVYAATYPELLAGALAVLPEITLFLRGDSNDDKMLDISDAVSSLEYLFIGDGTPACYDAVDANDDGDLDISDPIALLGFLYLNGIPLPPPNGTPGRDPTPDSMTCSRRYSTALP